MRRYPGRKKRRMRAPITRAVAAMAPRTSSGNASSPAGVYLKVVRRTILGGKGLGRGIGHRLRGGMKTERGRIKTYVRSLDDILGGGLPAGLDVLEAMAKMEDRRSDLYFLFEWLRSLGPLILLISEKPLGSGTGMHAPEEAYLADGIITFEMQPTSDLFVQRRLRVVKMRSTKHETGYYALSFDDGGFEITRAVTGPS